MKPVTRATKSVLKGQDLWTRLGGHGLEDKAFDLEQEGPWKEKEN